MDLLTEFLIQDLLENPKIVAIYGGGFKPPTKGHFTVAKKVLDDFPEIDELKIAVGSGIRDGVTQDESIKIWNIYKSLLSNKVTIEPAVAPVKFILDYAKNNPQIKVYWILGAREDNEDDIKDIESRTRSLSKYPNIEVKIITTIGGISGTKTRQAIRDNNKEQFFHMIPDVSNEEKEKIWSMISPVIKENLNEIGDASASKYKWEEVDVEGYYVYTRFITDSETQYDVDLETRTYVDNDNKELRALGVEFSAKPKGAERGSAKIVVNKGELYKVMSTITDIIKYYLSNSRLKIQAILYSPSKKSDEGDFGAQRDNLYKAFISKSIPGVKFEQKGEIVAAILPGVNEGSCGYDTDVKTGKKLDTPGGLEEGRKKKSDPRKGTGKKPEGSSRRLYTDENPKDTVGIKFKTKEDIVDTLNKTSFKAKPHVRQSQVINLIHQRVRAAYGKAKDPDVKARLKRGLDYIEKRKEMSKKKTERLRKQKTNENQQTNLDTFDRLEYYKNYFINVSPSTFNITTDSENIVISGINKPYPKDFNDVEDTIQVPVISENIDFNNLEELVTATQVICDNCGWEWEIADGGKDPYLCHKCGYDNNPFDLNEGDTYEKMAAKGKQSGNLKQGTVRARLNIPKDEKIPMSKINKEISRLKKMDQDKDKKGVQLGDKNQKYYKALQLSKTLKSTTNIKENDPFGLNELARQFGEEVKRDLTKGWNPQGDFVSLSKYMIDNGMNIKPLPKIKVIKDDKKNASDLLGKTAYYDPSNKSITLYTFGRHPKDVLRSFTHEMVHHEQNLNRKLSNITTTNTNKDGALPEIEKEAYEKGNMMLRNWEDSIKNSINEWVLDIPKFNQPKTFTDGLNESLNEITLSKDNAVEINGDLTGGKFNVGDKIYQYSIKNIPNPYKDLGIFYNIQFTPEENITSKPTKDTNPKDYIKILSTMYKIIVDFVEKEKPDYFGIASLDNTGDKNYHRIYANLTDNQYNRIPGYFRKDVNLKVYSPEGDGRMIVLKRKDV